jgi:hypothetical protein
MPEHPLHALARGKLGGWHGIPPEAGAAWVREGLGADLPDDGFLITFHGAATGPEGLLAWLGEGGRLELVELPVPRIKPEAFDALGEPELRLPTAWSRSGRQLAWPSRGLAVHTGTLQVIRVMGFAPMSEAEFAGHRFATAGRPPRR